MDQSDQWTTRTNGTNRWELLKSSAEEKMARPAGFEPATLGLEGRCSIQMSYGRILALCRSL